MTRKHHEVLKCLLLSTFLAMLTVPGLAQVGEQEACAYHPMSSKYYGVENGLPYNCVQNAITATDGKMMIIPCLHVQLSQGLKLYQFDGYQSYLRTIQFEGYPENVVLLQTGSIGTEQIYGYLTTLESDEIVTAFFRYSITNDDWIIQPIVTGSGDTLSIRNVVTVDSTWYFLEVDTTGARVWEYVNDHIDLVVEIPGRFEYLPVRNAIPFLVTDEDFWFPVSENLMYQVRRNTGKAAAYRFKSEAKFNRIVDSKLLQTADGSIYLSIQEQGLLFKADEQRKELVPYSGSDLNSRPGETLKHYVFLDDKGRSLFVHQFPDHSLQGKLQFSSGGFCDYTPVLRVLTEQIKEGIEQINIKSRDFEREMFAVGREFMAFEVTPRNAIMGVDNLGNTRGVIELSNDTLFLARIGAFDMHSGQPVSIADDLDQLLQLITPESDILNDNRGNTWFSTREGNLHILDPQTNKYRAFPLGVGLRRMALLDSLNIIYLKENHIYKFNTRSEIATRLSRQPLDFFIGQIKILSDGTILLATNRGPLIFDPETGETHAIDIGAPESERQVLCFHEDIRTGKLWIGTLSGGLKILDRESGNIITIDEYSGLSNNVVATILEDNDGDIWAGTFNGITILRPDGTAIGQVYDRDGLVNNECNRWSAFRLSTGKLFFGSPYGFSVIDPTLLKREILGRQSPLIYLTDLTFGNNAVGDPSFIESLMRDRISLPATARSLRVSYAMSGYAAPEGNAFAYRLDRQGSDWNYVGTIHDLALYDLPAGEYDILIKGNDYKGMASANTLRIPVSVNKFFYEQWWFYVLCAVPFLVLAMLWALYQRREKRKLERLVVERTSTISKQADALREMDRMKSRLYTNITHEFRTPLTVIQGLTDKVNEDPQAPEIIRRNTDSLLNLVNQMLDLRKLESGKMELHLVQSDIVGYLRYLGETARSMAELRGLQYHFLAPASDILMDFDPEKLARIVTNLLSNAIKFTPEGGDIYLQVENVNPGENNLTFKVTDTGIGIPEEKIEHIFDSFYQVDNDETRKGEGTGIGLTLVKELVSLMDGSLHVESRPGHGTTFLVNLPITHDAPLSDPGAQPETTFLGQAGATSAGEFQTPVSQTEDLDRNTVLIVEDNPDVVHYIGSCLKDNYNILIAMDGEEGVNKALELVPDLVVSDVMMPGKTGFELCNELKVHPITSHIPIILLTAKADADSKLQGLKYGADAYLAKPFNEQELNIRIENLIEMRARLQARYLAAAGPNAPEDPELQKENAFITAFKEILMEHLEDEHFGVAEMYQAMHISRTQLHNKITALTGRSASQFMRDIRLGQAQEMMLNTDLNISEIAFRVGFSDPKYFSRVFKEVFDTTPSEWMKNQQPGR